MGRYHVASTSQAMSRLGAIPHGTTHRRKHCLAPAVFWRLASGDNILLVVCTDWVSTCRYLVKHQTASVDTMLLCLRFIVLAGPCKAKDSVGEHHAVAFACTINEWLVLLWILTNLHFDSAKKRSEANYQAYSILHAGSFCFSTVASCWIILFFYRCVTSILCCCT